MGRLNFITQATFGALGKAALKPVYSRAHDAAASTSTGLSAGLRAALMALKALLADIQPRVIPYIDDGEPQAIIYADAFYQPGETRYKAGHFPAEVPVKPGSKGVHRQRRRPMGPDQGLRTRRGSQRRPRSFLVHCGARGMAPGLPACAIQGERLRRRLQASGLKSSPEWLFGVGVVCVSVGFPLSPSRSFRVQ